MFKHLFPALPNPRMLRNASFIADYVRRESPDCLLPMLRSAKVATLLAKALSRSFPVTIPVVHSNLAVRRLRDRIRYRRLFRHADHVVAVSRGVRADVAARTGCSAARVTAIYNPEVGPDLIASSRESPDHPWLEASEGAPRPPVVLWAGRFARVKDIPTLLRAFHRLSSSTSARLILLGGKGKGKHWRKTVAQIGALGLEGRVSMPGFVDNPYAFMARASLFVLSSRREGLSGVLIQALACGCPCVSTDCRFGPSEILDAGRVGPLVRVGDAAGLAEAMRRTLENPPPRELLLKTAARFSHGASVARYEALIAEVVRRRRAAEG